MDNNSIKNMKLASLTKEHRSICLSCFVFILLSQNSHFGAALTTFCVVIAGLCLLYIDLKIRKKIIEVAGSEAHSG